MQLFQIDLNLGKDGLLVMVELVPILLIHDLLMLLALGEIKAQALLVDELILGALFFRKIFFFNYLGGTTWHFSTDQMLRGNAIAIPMRWMIHDDVAILKEAVVKRLLILVLSLKLITHDLFIRDGARPSVLKVLIVLP